MAPGKNTPPNRDSGAGDFFRASILDLGIASSEFLPVSRMAIPKMSQTLRIRLHLVEYHAPAIPGQSPKNQAASITPRSKERSDGIERCFKKIA
jgi:hypothetical protein